MTKEITNPVKNIQCPVCGRKYKARIKDLPSIDPVVLGNLILGNRFIDLKTGTLGRVCAECNTLAIEVSS